MSGAAVIVCGSRGWTDHHQIGLRLDDLLMRSHGDLVVIQGGVKGADAGAHRWVRRQPERTGVVEETFHANWELHGNGAGPRRNQVMLERLLVLRAEGRSVLVLAFRLNGVSKGTDDMIRQASAAGVRGNLIHGMLRAERQRHTRRR